MSSNNITTIDNLPRQVNWKFYSGATWSMAFTWLDSTGTPIDLTGYTGALMMRDSLQSPASVVDITTTLNLQGQIVIAAPLTGFVDPTIFDSHTATLVTPDYAPLRLTYDLFLYSAGGIAYPIYYGEVLVIPESTHP